MPEAHNSSPAILRRDQQRALYAYTKVGEVVADRDVEFKEYKIAVHAIGAEIMRSGLAAAMSELERKQARKAVGKLMTHLAGAGIPGLLPRNGQSEPIGDELPGQVRALHVGAYMLATREMLQVILWFKRAVQAYGVEAGDAR